MSPQPRPLIHFDNRSSQNSRASLLIRGAFLTVALVVLASSAGAQAITGRITDAASNEPLAGARVSIIGQAQGAIARGDGTYRLPASAGTLILRVYTIGYSPQVAPVVVTGVGATRDYKLTKGGQQLEANIVTGTRLNDRTVLNAPVPVDVLGAAEIQQTGAVETNQILQLLAPSFNFPRPAVSDGTDHIRPSTLRGLGPDQVLVLVNGKRRHTSALVNVNGTIGRGSTGVDLNAIPASSIERIEILRDGAAAQYGSDAIAGVINVILKADPITDLGVQVGSSFTKIPARAGYSAAGAAPDERLTDGDVSSVDANTGMNFRGGGFVHVSGQYDNRGSTNRSLPDTRTQYLAGSPKINDPAWNNRLTYRQGDAHVNQFSAMLNSALPMMASGAQIYAFGGGTHREGQGAGNFRRSLDNNNVRAIYPDGFLPLINSTINDYSGTVGVRGELRGWRYDLSGLYGHNSFRFDITNTVNPTLGVASPTEFYAGTLKFGQATANLDLVRGFPVSAFSGPLNVALGLEARRDMYGIGAGEPNSYIDGGVKVLDGPNTGAATTPGSQVFAGFRPTDAGDHSRSNVAGYVDFQANVLPQFLLGVAGRSEHYSDFGGTTTGKVNARYEFIPGYALRGALSTGFRAPSLAQEFYASTATNFLIVNGVNTPVEIRTLPAESGPAKALGAEPLKAEKSVNGSLGLALAPLSNLNLTVDYYHIRIKDRIVLSGNFQGITAFLAEQGFPGVGSARFFTNAIDTRTNGVDVVARYALDLGRVGITRFTGGYNHTGTVVKRVSSTPTILASQQITLFDRLERSRIEEGQPHETLNLTLDHTLNRLFVMLHTTRYGKVGRRGETNPQLDQTWPEKWVSDANLSYGVTRQLRFTIGANNIFDIYPERNIVPLNNSGIFPYSAFGPAPFGYNGRFVYAKARYTM
jgi:iron complex outermembrane receptor protein